eukprot:357369-Chlamydomonas_euryale.AAC.5
MAAVGLGFRVYPKPMDAVFGVQVVGSVVRKWCGPKTEMGCEWCGSWMMWVCWMAVISRLWHVPVNLTHKRPLLPVLYPLTHKRPPVRCGGDVEAVRQARPPQLQITK